MLMSKYVSCKVFYWTIVSNLLDVLSTVNIDLIFGEGFSASLLENFCIMFHLLQMLVVNLDLLCFSGFLGIFLLFLSSLFCNNLLGQLFFESQIFFQFVTLDSINFFLGTLWCKGCQGLLIKVFHRAIHPITL